LGLLETWDGLLFDDSAFDTCAADDAAAAILRTVDITGRVPRASQCNALLSFETNPSMNLDAFWKQAMGLNWLGKD